MRRLPYVDPRFLVLALALTSTCLAQTGKVTFYSDALPVKDAIRVGVVPAGKAPFPGWLYDGNQRLAHFSVGRFITLRLEPGTHLFSASSSSKKPASRGLQLEISSGGNYCVRLSSQYVNWVVVPVQSYQGRIEQVPCGKAIEEAGKTKPLDKGRVEKAAQDKLDPSQAFPKEQP
jgi:hypothetical protein